MEDNIFNTTNTDFISYLRTKKIPAIKTEKINFRQISFCFKDKQGEISELSEKWELNPTKEMQLIQDFVVEKDKILKTIKLKMNDGGFSNGNY